MARFTSEKYPALMVSFANGRKVRFADGAADVDGDAVDLMRGYAKAHPDFEISEVDAAPEADVEKSDEKTDDDADDDEKSEPDTTGDEYDDMKVGDLRKAARDRGLDDAGSPDAVKARLRGSEAVG